MGVLDSKMVEGEGFKVVVLDIHTVVYSEPDRTATVEIEGGEVDGVVDWLVYASTVNGWEKSGTIAPLSTDDRATILHRVSEALALLGMTNSVV